MAPNFSPEKLTESSCENCRPKVPSSCCHAGSAGESLRDSTRPPAEEKSDGSVSQRAEARACPDASLDGGRGGGAGIPDERVFGAALHLDFARERGLGGLEQLAGRDR